MQRVQVNFDVFGHAFLYCAITSRLIGTKIDKMPRQIPKPLTDLPMGATGQATVTLGGCSVTGQPDRGFQVTLPLHIDMSIHALAVINESYSILATLPLHIGVQTWVPQDHSFGLWIYIPVAPIQGSEIALTVTPESWTNLVQRFAGLEDQVRTQVAQAVNDAVNQSDASRWFDIYKIIQDGEQSMMGS
jgi:hypothetical protein